MICLAEDTTFQYSGDKLDLLFEKWFKSNRLTLNVKKKSKMFSVKNTQMNLQHLSLKIGDKLVEQVGTYCKEKF